MSKRQPEGKIKDQCRKDAEADARLFWQVEGKGRNGVPDTLAERLRGGCMMIEFKRLNEKPTEQQYLRIYELREAGMEAWWCDSFDGYRALIAGDYKPYYPPKVMALIEMGTTADAHGRSRR